jgi:hypothetical protein
MRNCASGNLALIIFRIPGLRLVAHPGMTVAA